MAEKLGVMVLAGVMAFATLGYSQAARTFNVANKIACDHDGNCYDNDDIGASAFMWGIISAFGVQKNLVHFQFANNLQRKSDGNQYNDMVTSSQGWRQFPGFDSSVVFDCFSNTAATIAHFKKVAEARSASDKLFMACAGPMEMAWRDVNATAQASRKFITLISHSSWNEDFSTAPCTHTWNILKSSFSGDGVAFVHISDQNAKLGGGSNWSFLGTMPATTYIPASAWKWMQSRDLKSGDVSDCGIMWYLMTGAQNGAPADFETRFKSPLPMEGTTAIRPAAAMSSMDKAVSARVYRNGNVLQIHTAGMKGNGSVAVYNMLSQVVSKGTMTNGQAELSCASQPSGTYFVRIESTGLNLTRKILLQP